MKNKLLTLKELEEKLWWWKREENSVELERIKLFGYELAARNYELMRRSPNAVQFHNAIFLKLDRESRTTTSVAWGDPNEFPFREIYDLSKQNEIGWTGTRPPRQWNLRLSNRALTAAFLEYIDQQRELQKVSGNSSLKGKPGNRPDSWKYIEWLDMKRNKITGYDYGMASKAEKMSAKFLSEFKIAMVKKDEIAKKWGLQDYFADDSEEN